MPRIFVGVSVSPSHNTDTAAQDFGAVLYGEVEEGGDG